MVQFKLLDSVITPSFYAIYFYYEENRGELEERKPLNNAKMTLPFYCYG